MGIPEEDLGPTWLRDYDTIDVDDQSTDGGGGDASSGDGVHADTPAMKQFASALKQNVSADYVPHARKVFDDMAVPAEGVPSFLELRSALSFHAEIKSVTTDNVANHGNGAHSFATAMDEISKRYETTDAYAAARVDDITRYLGTTPQPGEAPIPGPDLEGDA